MAFSMGKKSESYTHKWICYVRGLQNEDLSYLIEKVEFVLHSSFENPVRSTTPITQRFPSTPSKFRSTGGASSKS